MRRFLATWIACWAINLAVTLAISLGWFRHADLRFETFAANHIVPALQAAVLGWWTSRPSWRRGRPHLRSALADPLAPVVLGLEAAVLVAALLFRRHPMIGIAVGSPVLTAWVGTKLLVTAAAFLLVARAGASWRIGMAALVLAALGAQAFWPWSQALVQAALPRVPTVLRWLAIDVPLFGVILLVVLTASDRLAGAPRAWVHAALASFTVAALITVVSFFLRPYFVEPWGALVRLAISLSSAAMLVGALLAVTQVRPR